MRRLVLFGLLFATFLAPLHADAAIWRSFSSGTLRLSLWYPAGWSVNLPNVADAPSVLISHRGKPPYSLTIAIVAVKPASTLPATVKRVTLYNPAFAHVRWATTKIGGKPTLAGVAIPQTEGGVGVAQGVYVTTWRRHVYLITTMVLTRPLPRTLNRFPAVYGQILKSLRFH